MNMKSCIQEKKCERRSDRNRFGFVFDVRWQEWNDKEVMKGGG